ncbi:MAG TPA: hypothetical protein VIT65_02865 [Microlunatus sp.]
MIFTLQPGVAATLPAQLLSVRLQTRGAATLPELDAVVVEPGGEERVRTDLVRHPGRLALAIQEPTLIRIRPAGGAPRFGTGAVFGLVVGAEASDADQAVLKSVDVSGLGACHLIALTPSGSDVVITAVAQSAHVVLPPGADRARVATREVIGSPTVPASEAASIRLAIDSSASMRPTIASGWLAWTVELISGIATVVSDLATLPTTACGRTSTTLPDHRFDQGGGRVVDELGEVPPSIGFRSALVPDGGGHGMTYLVTDAVPVDHPGERRDLVHLVILGGAQSAGDRVAEGTVTHIDVNGSPESLSSEKLTALARSLLSDYQRRFRGRRGSPS